MSPLSRKLFRSCTIPLLLISHWPRVTTWPHLIFKRGSFWMAMGSANLGVLMLIRRKEWVLGTPSSRRNASFLFLLFPFGWMKFGFFSTPGLSHSPGRWGSDSIWFVTLKRITSHAYPPSSLSPLSWKEVACRKYTINSGPSCCKFCGAIPQHGEEPWESGPPVTGCKSVQNQEAQLPIYISHTQYQFYQ